MTSYFPKTISKISRSNLKLQYKILNKSFNEAFQNYTREPFLAPLLFHGDALKILRNLPDESVDFVMTSPPYWSKREYENGGIGLEINYMDYVKHLADICFEIKRVLKATGSFWLNIGDTYKNKGLIGIPWRVAFELTDNQGWILRNTVVWNKLKGGMTTSTDRLGTVHENIFHFVKKAKGYYYNSEAIRANPRAAKIVNGSVVSATGVSGIRYKRQIELSTELSIEEKTNAYKSLETVLSDMRASKISDFRMIIRGQQRTTHSESEKVSGRARELREKGFYFLKYHPKGSMPNDVWNIIPEDTQGRKAHFASYPTDICKIPMLASCPPDGLVLDPFCGTGTTLLVARSLNRKSIGIDISRRYLKIAEERCKVLL